MLKMRDLCEVSVLFELQSHPSVYPYVREKAETSDAYYFITKQTIEAEANGELISRTIVDEYQQPIGTITLYDIYNQYGFLATWIGQPYFGKGYNKIAKTLFFQEVFSQFKVQAIFMKIRKNNVRSLRAATKLPYLLHANTLFSEMYKDINREEDIYDLFVIKKEHYNAYTQFSDFIAEDVVTGGEDVS